MRESTLAAPRSVEKKGRRCSERQSQDSSASHSEDYGDTNWPLRCMRFAGNAEIHLQPVGDTREGCDPVGSRNKERGTLLPEREGPCSKLEQPVLKRLHSVDEWPVLPQFWEDCLPVKRDTMAQDRKDSSFRANRRSQGTS